VMTFAERAAGEPQAIRAWFYPGELWGQEFVYPKTKAVELAKAVNLPVAYIPDEVAASIAAPPTGPAVQAGPVGTAADPAVLTLKDVPVLVIKPTGEVVQISAVFQAPPVQALDRTASLPKTASDLPLVALVGLLCLSVSVSLSKLCAR
jgi:hypothetical protein